MAEQPKLNVEHASEWGGDKAVTDTPIGYVEQGPAGAGDLVFHSTVNPAPSWMPVYLRADQRIVRLRRAIDAALRELGVPDETYPAPVANAVDILRRAVASTPPATGSASPQPDREGG